MTKRITLLLSLFLLSEVFFSCKKEDEYIKPDSPPSKNEIKVDNGRISFSNNETFTSLIEQSMLKKDPTHIFKKEGLFGASNFKPLSGKLSLEKNGRVSLENDSEVDELVPDEYFSHLLNADHELQIGENILKVTPDGTFICHSSKYQRLLEILNSGIKFGNDGAGMSKDIEEGIFYYDSFAADEPSEKIDYVVPQHPKIQKANGRETFDYLDASIYESFDTHSFGSSTVVGGWIEKVLGRREVEYIYFNSKERLKLNLYSVNYIVFSSIGITTEAQFKTWIGWGGDLKVNEIRMGWEGLALEFKIPHAPPPNVPRVSFEKLTLGDLGIDVASVNTYYTEMLNDLIFFANPKQIADEIGGEIQSTFSSTMSKTYNYVYQNVAPWQWDYYKKYVEQYRIMYPDKVHTVLGRYEEVDENAHKISKNFNWSTGVFGFSTNGTSFGPANFGLKESAITFKILKASVYSCAKYNNQWKGIRIIKED